MSEVELSPLPLPDDHPLAALRDAGWLKNLDSHRAIHEGAEYHAIVSRDNIGGSGEPDWRWHVSITGENDVPPWDALVEIAHAIRPGVPFIAGIPPRTQWMSVSPHCLHVFETKDENLTRQIVWTL